MNEQKWYVVKTSSRAEKKVAERIEKQNIKVYLPLIQSIRQWSDRKKKISLPLIPATIFVNCHEEDLFKLYNIQGFNSILHFLKKPAIVKNYEIENLKILLKESIDEIENNATKIFNGDKVEVIRGPLQGLIATSVEESRTHRLIVEIESLDQRFIVHVPKSFVRKLKQ